MCEDLLTVERTSGWEYRRVFISPDRRIWQFHRLGPRDLGFVDDVTAAIHELANQQDSEWRLLSLRTAEDDRGRCWLDVTLKRLAIERGAESRDQTPDSPGRRPREDGDAAGGGSPASRRAA